MSRFVHIHRYEKTEWGKRKTIVWKCTLDECSHYLHPEMIKGRLCLCYKCGHSFKLHIEKLRAKRPTCDACQGIPESVPAKPVKEKAVERKAVPDLKDIDIRELLRDL